MGPIRTEIQNLRRSMARSERQLTDAAAKFWAHGGVCCPSCGVDGYSALQGKQERRLTRLRYLIEKLDKDGSGVLEKDADGRYFYRVYLYRAVAGRAASEQLRERVVLPEELTGIPRTPGRIEAFLEQCRRDRVFGSIGSADALLLKLIRLCGTEWPVYNFFLHTPETTLSKLSVVEVLAGRHRVGRSRDWLEGVSQKYLLEKPFKARYALVMSEAMVWDRHEEDWKKEASA